MIIKIKNTQSEYNMLSLVSKRTLITNRVLSDSTVINNANMDIPGFTGKQTKIYIKLSHI